VTATHPAFSFLFTDIEGSTRLWEQHTEAMRVALARHDQITQAALATHRGQLVKRTGDGLHAAFADPLDGVLAMLQMQRALADAAAQGQLPLAIRCGLHAAAEEARDGDYYGPEVNRAARIMAAAHGGQMLLSDAVAQGLLRRLPAGLALKDLGAVRLRDLSRPERLWQVVAPPLREVFPALRSLEATPNNLSQQLNRFIGREQAMPQVRALMGAHRLVSLVGTGGIGKSRLSVQLAAELMDDYPDGVWCVELAPLAEGQRVPQAVATVLGLKEVPGQPLDDTLAAFVKDRRLLIILDNCEHVLNACAALAKRLMKASASLQLLATSREPLHVAGEAVYPVPALSAPNPQHANTPAALMRHEAVRLFVDRAGAVQPSFAVNAGNASALAEICHRLDGIPLAIELAAARARAMPIEAMARRLIDSFKLIATQDETVAPRQRTLRLLIDWSHDLLDDAERLLFARLSVFAGGFTLEAAEAVCADEALPTDNVIDLLARLVDKSLVMLDADSGRYRLLETVRQFAAEKLVGTEDAEVRQRHLGHYLDLAETAQRHASGPEHGLWKARLDADQANLLAAHANSAQAADGAELGLRLSVALRMYWLRCGQPTVGLAMTVNSLQRQGAPVALRARGLFDAGQICSFVGQYGDALRHLQQSLILMRETGDLRRVAAILQPMAMAALGLGDMALAARCADEAVGLLRHLKLSRPLAAALNAKAQLLRMESQADPARTLYAEALVLARNEDDRECIAVTLLNLAIVDLSGGSSLGVASLVLEALEIGVELDSQLAAIGVLDVSSALAIQTGATEFAAQLAGAATCLLKRTGLQRDPVDSAFIKPMIEIGRNTLGDQRWSELEQAGGQKPVLELIRELKDWLELP
jgi:predicted ATPase/class 3 adenylate cyclase